MVYVIVWLVLCFVVAYVATQKKRSAVGFFFLSFFLSPLVGLLVLIALPDASARDKAATVGGRMLGYKESPAASKRPRSLSGLILCPGCNRPNKESQSACMHCGTALHEQPRADTKACPMCAETIKAAAKKCRYCGHEMVDGTSS